VSAKSWKDEYLPPASADMSEVEAVEHSLRKWAGLMPLAREAHGLPAVIDWPRGITTSVVRSRAFEAGDRAVCWMPSSTDFVPIDDSNCALCLRSRKKAGHEPDEQDEPSMCDHCVLYQVRRERCDVPVENEVVSPYAYFFKTGDPSPMIRWLAKALDEAVRRVTNHEDEDDTKTT
jgi:hypothetical protein